MLKKTITYTDYNGSERTEDFYFNLTKAEIMEMEMSTTGGLAEMIQRIVAAQDTPAIIKIFKGALPYLICNVIVLLAISLWSPLTTWLPQILGYSI